jgi:hypothetical protein
MAATPPKLRTELVNLINRSACEVGTLDGLGHRLESQFAALADRHGTPAGRLRRLIRRYLIDVDVQQAGFTNVVRRSREDLSRLKPGRQHHG